VINFDQLQQYTYLWNIENYEVIKYILELQTLKIIQKYQKFLILMYRINDSHCKDTFWGLMQ